MTDQADSKVRESLSAMADNEASEFEFFRTIKLLSEDDELRQTWHRYQLASSVMRREASSSMADLSGQIASAVALEAEFSAPLVEGGVTQGASIQGVEVTAEAGGDLQKPHASSSNGAFQKFAVAASVAVAVVFGVQQLQLDPESLSPEGLSQEGLSPGNAGSVNIVSAASDNVASKAANQLFDNVTNVIDANVGRSRFEKPDNIGPRFQLPSGYAVPHVSARIASTASVQAKSPASRVFLGAENSAQNVGNSEAHQQIQSYLNRMMLRYAE